MSDAERDILMTEFHEISAKEEAGTMTPEEEARWDEITDLMTKDAKEREAKSKWMKDYHTERKNRPPPEYVPPQDEMAPQALKDMWHVYNNERLHDRAPSQKRMREFMTDDLKGFLSQMSQAEREWKSSKDASADKVDEGEKAALEKIEMLLEEFEHEHQN